MSESKGTSTFEKLFSRKLNKILKKKGNFDYLSWAHAWEIMKKNDPQAKTMYDGYDGDRVIEIRFIDPRRFTVQQRNFIYVSWGALNANPYAPAQIELQHTYDRNLFEKNYRAYVELIRDYCNQFNIPKTLDTGYPNKGVKSHLWVTNTYGGDHTDPYGYLSEMGVSKEKLAYDLAHGFTDENPTTSDDKPVIDPTRAGAANPTLTDGTNYAHIDQFGEIENANLHVAGWHIANYKYEYIFIMDYNTGKELARVKADGIYRPDVNQAHNTSGNVGYHVSFNMRNFPNKKVYVMMRATNDPEGNTKGGAQDFHDKRWYLNIPQR
ncbi:DUF1071 domain-containing protein [Enterococcus faecium]|uniref:DUF1071 domain-containing protein n=1 Tax=Enterococcus faecium TaxID=1352 RepID=UPI001244AFDE|nr:DUF1071 domain-containing protein [Enterococcus faecium]KAA9205791.1 DUF1071 domain-containing protein [Enterococcus faecium]